MTSGVYQRTKETRIKISEANKGEKNPMFGKYDLFKGEKNPMFGKRGKESPMFGKENKWGHHSKESKRKISESLKGEKNYWFGKKGIETSMFGRKNEWGHHTQESKRKISESVKGEKNSMFGRTGEKNPFFGKCFSEEERKKIIEKRKFQIFPFKDSKPETKLQKALAIENIIFEKHKPITGQPDIFIDPNICIFVDGCFWHCCPIHNNIKNEYTVKKKNRDEYVNKKLIDDGYKILRFWEHEINNNLENCVEKIKEELERDLETEELLK